MALRPLSDRTDDSRQFGSFENHRADSDSTPHFVATSPLSLRFVGSKGGQGLQKIVPVRCADAHEDPRQERARKLVDKDRKRRRCLWHWLWLIAVTTLRTCAPDSS